MVKEPVRGTNVTRNLKERSTEVRALTISRVNVNCDVLELQVINCKWLHRKSANVFFFYLPNFVLLKLDTAAASHFV